MEREFIQFRDMSNKSFYSAVLGKSTALLTNIFHAHLTKKYLNGSGNFSRRDIVY